MFTQHRSHRRRFVGLIAIIVLMTALRGTAVPAPSRPRTSNSASDVEDSGVDDAIALQQLTRVFGVESISDYYRHSVRHRSPPEYMVQLYDTIAYTDGISKTAAPYEADVVRGIPDRGRHFFHIDVKRTILFYNKKPS